MTDTMIEYDWQNEDPEEDGLVPDGTQCAAGKECSGYNAERDLAAPVGVHLVGDYDYPTWAHCWHWKSTGPSLHGQPLLFCEDCESFWRFELMDLPDAGEAEDPTGRVMLSGTNGPFQWVVTVQDRETFAVSVNTADPTGGIAWEKELGVFTTVGQCLMAVQIFKWEDNAADVLAEVGDLNFKIRWLLTHLEAWSPEGTFAFPDGELWRRDP